MNRIFSIIIFLVFSNISLAEQPSTPSTPSDQIATQKTEQRHEDITRLQKPESGKELKTPSTNNESIPPTIYVALGAIIAALLTGFFSFLNLISAKENKVSEFRLEWINGLRCEIAEFNSAIQDLARAELTIKKYSQIDIDDSKLDESLFKWFETRKQSFSLVAENLTKIQLRLNPKQIAEHPESDEAKLMSAINKSRKLFNEKKFKECAEQLSAIRDSAAPLLKSTWDLVKNGETSYRKIRNTAQIIIAAGALGTLATIALIAKSYI